MTTKANHKYTEAVGRRKTSVARVRIEDGKYSVSVNDKDLATYFPTKELQHVVESSWKYVPGEKIPANERVVFLQLSS